MKWGYPLSGFGVSKNWGCFIGKSTGPKTKEGRKRCGIVKTVHGGKTRAIRAARPAKMAELKVIEKIIEKW